MRPIDGDKLIKIFSEVRADYDCDHPRYDLWSQMIDLVESEPTIDAVEVVRGEWIDAEIPLESGGSMPIQACNLCKTFYPLAYTGGGHRFCPNCGAKMKGADDEID